MRAQNHCLLIYGFEIRTNAQRKEQCVCVVFSQALPPLHKEVVCSGSAGSVGSSPNLPDKQTHAHTGTTMAANPAGKGLQRQACPLTHCDSDQNTVTSAGLEKQNKNRSWFRHKLSVLFKRPEMKSLLFFEGFLRIWLHLTQLIFLQKRN